MAELEITSPILIPFAISSSAASGVTSALSYKSMARSNRVA
jgi:hypothetical protein